MQLHLGGAGEGWYDVDEKDSPLPLPGTPPLLPSLWLEGFHMQQWDESI